MKNGLYTRIYKKAFSFIVILLVFGVAFGLASLNIQKVKASTNNLIDLQQYVINDWEQYTNYSGNGLTITNQGDGTILLNGTTSAAVSYYLPGLSSFDIPSNNNFDYYIALLKNGVFTAENTSVILYISYNNNDAITNLKCNLGGAISGTTSRTARLQNIGLRLTIGQGQTFDNMILTPFCMLQYPRTVNYGFTSLMNYYVINSLLGPTTSQPPDLTKVNYIQEAINISLPISSQINKSFGNELESLIQYTMQAGDEITVNNNGVATNEIDLLTMTAGLDIYKMTFINDALSNDYNNILLYYNNATTIFYNDNLGELSAQNIIDFRLWASMAINANATITSASANNNNILSKIFVYSTGTNYETGYTAGYNDAMQDVEEALQEAWADGLEQGYQDGYTTGYGEGYDQGAIEGVDSSWLINLFGTIDTFFSIHLFPNLTIGTLFAIPFVLSIAWVIIRILRGGGYGD